jgi:hypothetical protein
LGLDADARITATAETHFKRNLAGLNATNAADTFETDFYWTAKDTATFFSKRLVHKSSCYHTLLSLCCRFAVTRFRSAIALYRFSFAFAPLFLCCPSTFA